MTQTNIFRVYMFKKNINDEETARASIFNEWSNRLNRIVLTYQEIVSRYLLEQYIEICNNIFYNVLHRMKRLHLHIKLEEILINKERILREKIIAEEINQFSLTYGKFHNDIKKVNKSINKYVRSLYLKERNDLILADFKCFVDEIGETWKYRDMDLNAIKIFVSKESYRYWNAEYIEINTFDLYLITNDTIYYSDRIYYAYVKDKFVKMGEYMKLDINKISECMPIKTYPMVASPLRIIQDEAHSRYNIEHDQEREYDDIIRVFRIIGKKMKIH